ncbi:MAG: hypothetical protein L0Z55_10995 [Planctomycetes bacterium]|nr:hypothetical protein [Planctomycetota bacterium]
MTGTVRPVLQWMPAQLKMASLAGNDMSLEFEAFVPGDLSAAMVELKATKSAAKIRDHSELEPSKRWRVVVDAVPSSKPANSREELIATMRVPGGKTVNITIPVQISHQARIQMKPSGTVSFSKKETSTLKAAGAPPITKSVEFKSLDPSIPFAVTGAQVSGVPEGTFDVQIEEKEAGKLYTVIVALKAFADQRTLSGKLTVTTNDPGSPKFDAKLFCQFDTANAAAGARPSPAAAPSAKEKPPAGASPNVR